MIHAQIIVPSENSGEWLWYIRGATEIVQRARLGNQSNSNIDYGDLLDWVYFHDSMSRFTRYHWGHKYLAAKVTDTAINHVHGISQSSPLVEERAVCLSINPMLVHADFGA